MRKPIVMITSANEQPGENPRSAVGRMDDDGEGHSHNESHVVKDGVKRRRRARTSCLWHRRLSEHAYQSLTQEIRCIEWVAADHVDDQEPDCDCGGADEAPVITPSRKKLWCRSAIHSPDAVGLSCASGKIPCSRVYSKRLAVRIFDGHARAMAPFSPLSKPPFGSQKSQLKKG